MRGKKLRVLKKDLRKNAKKINEEVRLEKEAILLLKKHAKGAKLTKAEKKIVATASGVWKKLKLSGAGPGG